ncbi:sugar phosphate isomerase/epimerase family protein [Pontibacter anaerobius]|uniref:TIM barrel protein n=1 Tax=Pontibacter anaerobius TaxID=2993940 RepID=A0ABT3RBC6_9BACT|nr:TIM barrel protein [Pontibacter anaerobius]MCX2739055.1 TIM barrel protein [Pontibacter anaerobius]
MSTDRRKFLQQMGSVAAGLAGVSLLGPGAFAIEPSKKLFFKLSLAQWSLHKSLFNKEIDTLDFPGLARKVYKIDTVEYVNQFFKDKVNDQQYLAELLKRSKGNGVLNNMIMIDVENDLGDQDRNKRMEAVDVHKKWADAAKYLECNMIRVNAFGAGGKQEAKEAVVDGLGRLGEYCNEIGIELVTENHGGLSSDADWLADVLRQLDKPYIGSLPDFTNWCIKREGPGFWDGKCIEEYDPYKGVAELMPFAKGVSAKAFNFDKQGNAMEIDYPKMLKIVKDAGFTGYVGIEYEGESLPEKEGILKTKALLERVGAAMS